MPINIFELRNLAEIEIIHHLETTGDSVKDLIIEAGLFNPIERIIKANTLKKRNVDKFFKLEQSLASQSANLVYILTPDTKAVLKLINHVKSDNENNIYRKRTVLFYHGSNFVTNHLLESEGVIGDLKIEDLTLNFIPLESDVASMEFSSIFRQLFIDQTHLPLFTINKCLSNFMSFYGVVPTIYSVGINSHKLVKMLGRTIKQSVPSNDSVFPQIGTLIVLDRSIDYITVCSSQLSSEGLMADFYGIRSGYICTKDKKKHLLTDSDPIFKEFRDLSIMESSEILRNNFTQMQEKQAKISKTTEISQVKGYVQLDLQNLLLQKESLTFFMDCLNDIIEGKKMQRFDERLCVEENYRLGNASKDDIKFLEWNIVSQQNELDNLKLLCLWSICCSKNSKKVRNSLQDSFIKSYGLEHISTFANLSKSGLFGVSQRKANDYDKIAEKYQLIPSSPDDSPFDTSQVFAGKYRSLSCQLVERLICHNNKNEPDFYEYDVHSHLFSTAKPSEDASKTYAVFYIGGICHSEISSLRMIAQKHAVKLIIMTTAVINGADLMSSHIDSV